MEIPEKTFQAGEVVKNPALLNGYYGYALLVDQSMGSSYDNMVRALNTLTPDWTVIGMTKDDTRLVVLVQRGEKPKRTAAEGDE